MKLLIDYKGKFEIIQDELDDECFDVQVGEISDEEITDSFLKRQVERAIWYGIPAYIGKDKALNERVEKLYKEYEEQP